MRTLRLCALSGLIMLLAARAAGAPIARAENLVSPGIHLNVGFNNYPPIASASEILSRMLSPLAVEATRRKLKLSGGSLPPQLFDIASEKFVIYVPRRQPTAGYAVLVFIPASRQAQIPQSWLPVLDRYGVLFVSAANSGNDADVLERRVPLALAALANIQASFKINPASRLIGGFSGGSRVAMQVALAYPDQFDGAFLNAGSDRIGENPAHLPSPGLFRIFQGNTRFAYATGAADEENLSKDSASMSSMLHWCSPNISARNEAGVVHEMASAATLDGALRFLLAPAGKDHSANDACQASRQKDVRAALATARVAIESARKDLGRKLLLDVDLKFGGLAAPDTLSLADECGCGILDPEQKP